MAFHLVIITLFIGQNHKEEAQNKSIKNDLHLHYLAKLFITTSVDHLHHPTEHFLAAVTNNLIKYIKPMYFRAEMANKKVEGLTDTAISNPESRLPQSILLFHPGVSKFFIFMDYLFVNLH